MTTPSATPEDIIRYRTFISGTLVPALQGLEKEQQRLEQVSTSCREFAKLVSTHDSGPLPILVEHDSGSLPILVDIGQGCFANAVVPDPSTFVVDTGLLGVHVRMEADEAVAFVAARANLLDRKRVIVQSKIDVVRVDLEEAGALLSHLQTLLLDPHSTDLR
eukprot:CAMPEP_0171897364 /NCGR_PEP_ID=MMETSP0992-20121227/48095_1 /TAXON_ID=483369 /ORGANISM="non described non described, Strain CCMP2098" /LENGTH=161 /DNA_ID=CAMNT_0012525485 /DNA_START=32 /DNA_END=517 /DNA_ORIENTATION=+